MSNAFNKQPSEVFVITMHYASRLTVGETITSKTVTAVVLATGVDATSTVIKSSTIVGTDIDVGVQGGTDGVNYKITIKVGTSGANILEEDIIMLVREG